MKKEAEKQEEICIKIEQNLVSANENMENANRQLNQRSETHRINNKLYIWFAIFLIISLLGIGTYIYYKYFKAIQNVENPDPIV